MIAFLSPRGIRNNNPGNIRLGNTVWEGQKTEQADTSFVEFSDPVMGLRALMRILLNYYTKYGLDTVQSIINRWAPPHENPTDHYIYNVAKHLAVKRSDPLPVGSRDILVNLAAAMVLQENGLPPKDMPQFWYENSLYVRAADLALNAHNQGVMRN